jgi:hypothetical protein
MIDFYLTRFYQDVKDLSWPDIVTYNDILRLPDNIYNELRLTHNLDRRLSEIESADHWQKINRNTNIGFKKNNIIFVPVLKCASTYFTQLFLNELTGWTVVNLHDQDWKKVKAFGCIMHPLTRRLKGIVESLVMSYNTTESENRLIYQLTNDKYFQNFISCISVCDSHSMPYTTLYGDYLYKINWIPMEIGHKNTILAINDFLETTDLNDRISSTKVTHASWQNKLHIYKLLLDLYFNHKDNEFQGMIMFADDLKFYHNLIKRFNRHIS